MKEEIKQRMDQKIEIALTKLNHVPYILSKEKKMAVWSDIRESLFLRCVHPRCSVVLSAMKSHYRYPASEKVMHPCTPSEQLQFIKQYMVVSTGTLLVDLNVLRNKFELMILYDMVKIKHDLSDEELIKSCRSQSGIKKQGKHFQKCTENPLWNLTKKMFLPSIQRKISKGDKLREKSSGVLIKSVLYNAFGEDASTALVPMRLLQETYPASAMFLEEAVRLYIIGRCEQSNLKSVSQCSMEEGYQFSRFLAMQYGFDKQWPCLTSNSLLMSWEEFWQNSTENNNIRVIPDTNVSVITLNCKDIDVYGEEKTPSNRVGSTSVQLSGDKDIYNTTDTLKEVKMKSDIDRQMLTYDQNADANDKHMKINMNNNLCQVDDENQTSGFVSKNQMILVENQNELKRSKSDILEEQVLYQKDTQTHIYNKETMHVKFPDVHMSKKTSHKDTMSEESMTQESRSLQNVALVEKIVTRSRSHNSVHTCKEKGRKNKAGQLETHNEIFKQKNNMSDPDANNSAVHELASKIRNSKEKNENLLKTKVTLDDDIESEQCMCTESKESIMTSQTDFETGNIEVSITNRNKLTGDEVVTDMNQLLMDAEIEVDKKRESTDKAKIRTEMKISSATFTDEIPDLLSIEKKGYKAEICSFEERMQSTHRKNKSSTEKLGVRKTEKESMKPNEHSTSMAKRKVNTINNKETSIEKDNVDFQFVNCIKEQKSPVENKTKSSCKSACTLPGPVNMIRSKAKSASLVRAGKLPNEIISNLKQQASNSISSVVGNSDVHMIKCIVASGKEIPSPRNKETNGTKSSADSSCFQDERISMRKDKFETTNNTTRRPTSSFYNQSYAGPSFGNGPSIMTGTKVPLSNDRVKSPIKISPPKKNNTKLPIPVKQTSPSPSIRIQATPTVGGEVDVPNFGSSSSKTPDIYDEFARKRKPRTHKADLQIIKGKKIVCERKHIPDTHEKSFDTMDMIFQKTSQSSNTLGNASTDLRQPDEIKSAPNQNADIMSKVITTKLTFQHANICERPKHFTSTLRKIQETDLKEPNTEFQQSGLGVKTESNSNQYSTCSMCKHESGKKNNSEINLNNEEHHDCSMPSSLDGIHADPSLPDSSSCVMHQEQSKSDIINNVATDVSANVEQSISLLGKSNMFAGCIWTPKLSESLEDIENIKNNIRINPIETSLFENSLIFNSKKELNCMSLSDQEKKRNYIPPEFKIHNTKYRHNKYDSMNNHTAKGCSVYNSIKCMGANFTSQSRDEDNSTVFELPHVQTQTTFNGEHNNTYLNKTSNLGQDIGNQTSELSNKLLHSGANKDDVTIDNSLSNVECNELIKHLFNFESSVLDNFALETTVETDEFNKESSTSESSLKRHQNTHKNDNEIENCTNPELLTDKSGSKIWNTAKSFREVVEENRATNPELLTDKSGSKILNTAKSFREVVEEKRATNRMELSKTTFWKSDKHKNKTKEICYIGNKQSVKSSKKKKSVTKPFSDIETVSAQYEQINEGVKKKRSKTCTTRLDDRDISSPDRTTVCNSRPKTADSKSANERKLRTRGIKSHETSGQTSCTLKGKHQSDYKNQKQNMIEKFQPELDQDTSSHPELSLSNPKSIARQRKLRLKTQDKFMSKGSQRTEQLSPDISLETDLDTSLFYSQHVKVDESKIICETIPYENILETEIDSSYYNDTDILTETFITHCKTSDLQNENLDHSNRYCLYSEQNKFQTVPVSNCNEDNVYHEDLTNSSHNAMSQLSNEITDTGQCSENTFFRFKMDNNVIDNLSEYCVHQNGCGDIKHVDLSELPQSVLEVVLSDNLMEMDGSLPVQFETEKEMFSMNIAGEELCNDAVDTNPLFVDGIPIELQLQNIDDTNQVDLLIKNKYSDDSERTHHEMTEHISNNCQEKCQAQCTNTQGLSEVTDNGITLMHPNGTQIILTENHPAFAIFSDMFEVQNTVQYGQESESEILETQINEEKNRLINESEQKTVLASADNFKNIKEHLNPVTRIRSHCQQELLPIKPHQTPHKSTNSAWNGSNTDRESIAEEVVSFYVDPSSNAEGRHCTVKKTFSHSENIFDALNAELNEMKQQKITSSQIELFTETLANNLNNIKVVNNSSDFEDDLIQMIKENIGSYASNLKESIESDGKISTIKQLGRKTPFHSSKTDTVCANSHCVANAFCNITPVNSSDHVHNDQHFCVFSNNYQDKHITSNEYIKQTSQSVEYPNSIKLGTVDNLSKTFDLNKRYQENDQFLCSDSDSSKTYEYGVESHSDLSDTCDNTSGYDDSSDADYYPADEESEVNLNEIEPTIMNKTSVGSRQNNNAGTKETNLTDTLQLKSSGFGKAKNGHKQGFKKGIHRNIKAAYINLSKLDETECTKECNLKSCRPEGNYLLAKCTNELTRKMILEKDDDENGNREKKSSFRRKSKKKNNRGSKLTGIDYDSDEDNYLEEDTLSANNLVTMQKLYFDILKKSGSDKNAKKRITDSIVDIENILSDGFPLKRDRDISRAESKADRLKEGTGSLNNLENDDCNDAIINDPSINCKYQVVEDEDGITLGGVVYYNEYVLPFVYINGYKYTPLKDAATLFQPDCCSSKCRIPKSVMTKNKRLIKTFSTWEQVYKLELIKSKKGPPVTTGDMLVKLDTLVSLLPTLLLDIIAQHTGTKLKTSQDCDMTSYVTLQKKLN